MSLQALGFGGRGAGVIINDNRNQDNRSLVLADAAALKRAQGLLRNAREQNDQEILIERAEGMAEGVVIEKVAEG